MYVIGAVIYDKLYRTQRGGIVNMNILIVLSKINISQDEEGISELICAAGGLAVRQVCDITK